MGHHYDRGYKAGQRDAQSGQPYTGGHSMYALGYRDGYLDAKRAEARGR